ncbi:hypothetical protein K7432_007209 [Basidiobolus ranarum]|uniref:SH3 domain-containing protein n=1 Tax=Basidiobolus ranarum TaxID=34480 RepID=A0ABR2WTP0_9FUNG
MLFSSSFLPAFVFLLSTSTLISSSRLQQDCTYLSQVFYPALNGHSWFNDSRWEDSDSDKCCSWFGVECKVIFELRVYGLNLPSNNLFGEFPSDIDKLDGLNYLKLDDNHIFGRIPPNINRMTQLQYISLEGSKLNGSIPDEFFTLELRHVNFNYNDLWGEIPGTLRIFKSYDYFGFKDNQLLGKVPPFNMSDDSDGCDLRGNQFTCIWPGVPSSWRGTSDLVSCESLLSDGPSLSDLLKVGVSIGVVLIIVVIVACLLCRRRYRRRQKTSPNVLASTNELIEYPAKPGDAYSIDSTNPAAGRVYPVLVTGVAYRQGKVQRDFFPENEEQIEIRVGEQVLVKQIRPDHWVYGRNLNRNEEKDGLFPLKCVSL